MNEMLRRVKKVFDSAGRIDEMLLVNSENGDPNFLYLTGFTSGVFEDNILIVKRSKLYLFTNPLEYHTALRQKFGGLEVINNQDAHSLRARIKGLVAGKVVGTDGANLPMTAYLSIKKVYAPRKIVDISDAFNEARAIKDAGEIRAIRKAVAITKKALSGIENSFEEGITELELASKFDYIAGSLGAGGMGFRTIVAFGKNSALPHHFPDSTRLRAGDFVLIDAGAKVGNYGADMTRTFIFKERRAKNPELMKDMLNTVKGAQLRAIEAMKAKRNGADVHNAAEEYINSASGGKYRGTFIHSLGHSIGLETHDGIVISKSVRQKLKEGMVLTAEPGIYINGFGGVRIEDDVLITKDGAVVL